MERRLAAILAADVVGYSRLIENDEVGTLSALKERRISILAPLVSEHRGRVVKLMGDGVLVEFASAVNAVACAVELQKRMEAANGDLTQDRRVVLRIGVNVGDVVVEGGDLYGDGVNIAARLQQLAEPGDIWIARAAYEQVEKKLALDFEDLGSREMKNIARPVHAFRVLAGAPAAVPSGQRSGSQSKPSIAVLQFANLSGIAAQDYFAWGITDSIITNLSRFRDLFVIARQSTLAYEGKAVKIQDVSRELGVRYLLEGSVQRSNDRVRITAQLVDGATGRHLWAERYDRGVEDIFAVQDDVTETIVGTLASTYGGRLHKAWQERSEGRGVRNFQAFDSFLAGIEMMDHFTKEDITKAREYFGKAVRFDPNYGKAYAKLAWSHIVEASFGWSEDIAGSWRRGLEYATVAIERDDDEPWGHWALAGYYMYCGQHDRAISEFEKALELNPNDADVLTDFGWCLSYAGRSREGLELAHKAMRINPRYPEYWMMQLGQICFDARKYQDAVTALEGLRALDTMSIRLYLAASHAALGHAAKARSAIDQALKLDPLATLKRWTSSELAPYKEPNDLEHFRDGLRKAGLPD